jgi:hypothetical protein
MTVAITRRETLFIDLNYSQTHRRSNCIESKPDWLLGGKSNPSGYPESLLLSRFKLEFASAPAEGWLYFAFDS